MKRVLDWLPVAMGVVFLAFLASLQWSRISRGQNDFAALYAGALLAGTPDLYSRPANEAVIRATTGVNMQSVVYTRAPFYAALLKPLSFLPYLTAWTLFSLACLCTIVWFVAKFRSECEALPLYASFCIPVGTFLPQGQDTPFLLLFAAGSILLVRQKRDFLAGLVLAMCSIKFHLFLLVPLLLLVKKRWSILAGGCSGIAALFLFGLAVAGVDSSGEYVRRLRDPWINFSPDMMPNLHGLSVTLGQGTTTEIVLIVLVAGAFLWLCTQLQNYELLFAFSLLCGLLVSYHSGISDQILLLLIFVLVMNSCEDKPLRGVLALMLTPLPYFIGNGISVVIPLLALTVLGLAVLSIVRLQWAGGAQFVVQATQAETHGTIEL